MNEREDFKCLKCLQPLTISDEAWKSYSVTCPCGAAMGIVHDSWFDGEDDHAMVYLELEPPDQVTRCEMPPSDFFPELADFELEMQGNSGAWSVFRYNESDCANHVLHDRVAVMAMLAGGETIVVNDGVRTRCRLKPKAWLPQQQFAAPEKK